MGIGGGIEGVELAFSIGTFAYILSEWNWWCVRIYLFGLHYTKCVQYCSPYHVQ